MKKKQITQNQIAQNQKGQGMIEYIILVCLMAIGTIGMVRVLGEGVNVKFNAIVSALQGESPTRRGVDIPESWQKRRDLKSFLNGTTSSSGNRSSKKSKPKNKKFPW